MQKSYIKTYKGAIWTFADAANNAMDPDDIAHSLALQCRFGGHIDTFYSIAQHCCYCADVMAHEHKIYGLLHDAHEALIGNIMGPFRRLLDTSSNDTVTVIERASDMAVYRMADIPPPTPEIQQKIDTVDTIMLATEMRDIRTRMSIDARLPHPFPECIVKVDPWPWELAKEQWLDRYNRYRDFYGRYQRAE